MPQTLLYNIQDYIASSLEFAEINARLIANITDLNQVQLQNVSVPSLDTMALGFVTGQLAYAPNPGRMVIYGNCAPRRTSDRARKDNFDHGIKYAKLKNGTEIINVYSEQAFGFVKKDIVEFKNIKCPNSGSQFRSRDFFPLAVAKIIDGNYEDVTEDLDVNLIPDIEHDEVAWTDGFGNVKTTMRMSDLKKMGLQPGNKVQVIMNNVSMMGVISVGGFQVDRGVLAINAGSSGYEDPFVELFLRVHHMSEKTAAVRFDYPEGGTKFEIKKLAD